MIYNFWIPMKACYTQFCQGIWFGESLMSFVVYKTKRNADQRIKALEVSSATCNGHN
uniref:Uncharacterized protein n=1 Tax=Prolemur simus TaxID=1328070 RepID=A0A8C9AQX5_PROSS